jgi:hypothetical protein
MLPVIAIALDGFGAPFSVSASISRDDRSQLASPASGIGSWSYRSEELPATKSELAAEVVEVAREADTASACRRPHRSDRRVHSVCANRAPHQELCSR